MYRCEMCGLSSAPGELINRKVVETRTKEYPRRTCKGKTGEIHDPGGDGYETVREINICSDCLNDSQMTPGE